MADEFEFDENDKSEEDTKENPYYGSADWEKFVMDKFLPDELYNGKNPTLNGMRRVSIQVLGKPIKSAPIQVHANLPVSAYCLYQIEFENGMTFGAAADGHVENIGGQYSIYPTAIAESRAEARTYRKALLLSTASAEEIKGNEKIFDSVLDTVKEFSTEDPISDQVKSIIEAKCKQLKVNLEKFYTSEGVDFKKATKSDGIKLSKKLTEMQQSGEVSKEIK